MHRSLFLKALTQYEETWATGLANYRSFDRREEALHLKEIREFTLQNKDCFERTCVPGHITGAALVVNPSLTQVLLTLHRKLGKWLQLGGHCDGDPLVHQTALREGEEESGLKGLQFLPFESIFGPGLNIPLLFDLDVHEIPARKEDPAHIHYDARYLIVAPDPKLIVRSEESLDLRWHNLSEAYQITDERSMIRQFDKLTCLKSKFDTR